VKRRLYVSALLMTLGALVLATALRVQAADPEEGKKVYMQFCASCHGQSGKGDGPAAAALNPKPRDHTDRQYMSSLSDEQLFKVIKEGGASVGKSPLMPPWGPSIKDEQIKDVIAYVRTLCCK
jgi:cytochrome c oxidase cbb3-type subunit 3